MLKKFLRDKRKKIWKKLRKVESDILFFVVYPFVYKCFSLKKIDEHLVLMVTGMFNTLPDNFKIVAEEMEARGYYCKIILKPPHKKNKFYSHFLKVKQYLLFQKYYAQCKICFLVENYRPANANPPRKGVQVVQLWHACGALKKVGYSTVDYKWEASLAALRKYKAYEATTMAVVSSDKIVGNYAEAFNLPDSMVHPFGIPRTDMFFDPVFVKNARSHIEEVFPEIGSRKILLYAPTFRGNSLNSAYAMKMLDYMLMKRYLGQQYVIINKFHPLVAKKVKFNKVEEELYGDFVFDGSNRLNINEALCAADILITDYSTVMFEYALLERPMIFFAYDVEQYCRDRGFYYDYKSMVPGAIVKDTAQIIDEVLASEKNFDRKQVQTFCKDFMSGCDGNATKRIVDFVICQEMKKEA